MYCINTFFETNKIVYLCLSCLSMIQTHLLLLYFKFILKDVLLNEDIYYLQYIYQIMNLLFFI